MEIGDETLDKNTVITWDIENFNFCWHKTGECLESPLFYIHAFFKTSWKLLLYPRGEDDGEYISCYLLREEGGPEVVEVDFKLRLSVEKVFVNSEASFLKIYSFKYHQREGRECFIPRRICFAPLVSQKKGFTLTFECSILNMDKCILNHMDFYFRTVIETESISGTEIFDDDSSLNIKSAKNIEVKDLLEDEVLFTINVSHFEKSLVIKVYPKSCRKIKYAVCKISTMKHGSADTPIQHVRTWIGEIGADIWKYYVPETEPTTRDLKSSSDRSFLLHYDLAFSTGSLRYFDRKKFSFPECFNASLKNAKSPETALAAMENVLRNHSSPDLEAKKIYTDACFTHRAILQTRCPKLKFENNQAMLFRYLKKEKKDIDKFFMFLYCDKIGEFTWKDFIVLYTVSEFCELELLNRKCLIYLRDNLNIFSAIMCFVLATGEDFQIKKFVIKYIFTHADDVFASSEWRLFCNIQPNWAMKIMLLKYKMPKSDLPKCINTDL